MGEVKTPVSVRAEGSVIRSRPCALYVHARILQEWALRPQRPERVVSVHPRVGYTFNVQQLWLDPTLRKHVGQCNVRGACGAIA